MKKKDYRLNCLYNATIGGIVTVTFFNYLKDDREFEELRLISKIGEHYVILQSACNQIIFKAEILCKEKILIKNAYSLASFQEIKVPNEELFRIGEINSYDFYTSPEKWYVDYSEPNLPM